MNVQQKVQTLEALLSRVKKNASSPRSARTTPAMAAVVAPLVAATSSDNDLPPELAHAVFAPPASRRHEEPAPDSKPRLVALAPPLATAGRAAPATGAPPRSPTPAYGIAAQTPEPSLGAKGATPKAPAVAPTPTPKPTRVEAKTAPPPAKPAARPEAAKPAPPAVKAPPAPPPPVFAKPAPLPLKPVAPAAAATIPQAAAPAGRAGARTLMGTGLGEVRAAIAQAAQIEAAGPSAPPPAVVPKIADETTGDGETLIKRSPLYDELGESEDESTRLMPQPTQEELIAASESYAKQVKPTPAAGAAPRVIVQPPVPVIAAEESTGEGETLIKESPLAAAAEAAKASPKPPAISPRPPPALPTPVPAAMEPIAAAAPPAMDLPAMAAVEMTTPAMAEPHEEALPEPFPTAQLAPRPLSEPPMAEAGPPSVPTFLRPGSVRPAPGAATESRFATGAPPLDAPLPPPRKRGVASMFGVGLAAAALFAAGGFLAMRGGWIQDFAGVRGHATSSPSAKPLPMPTASSLASAQASAVPTASAEAAPPPAPSAAASAEPAASAAPSGAPAGDASALPPHKGYLVVKSDKSGDVYMNGHLLGKTSEPITVDCGIRFIRLGNAGANAKSPSYIGAGRSVNIACRNTTETTLPGPVGREPAGGPAPEGAPPAPAPPSPEL